MRPRRATRLVPDRRGENPDSSGRGRLGSIRRGRFGRSGLIGLLLSVFLGAAGARADVVRYAWTGFVEATAASGNPWALQGDGLAVTSTDGTPFSVVAFVETDAGDLDGSLNPNLARFPASGATLTIGGHVAKLGAVQLEFSNDNFSGLFDSVRFATVAELFGAPLSFSADVRLAPSSFSLANPAAPDAPPRFTDRLPIQFGGSVSTALVTFPANAAVSARLETCPGPRSVAWSVPGVGIADGIAVTVANAGSPGLDTFPLRGPDFAAQEQCSNARSLTYATGSDWTLTLSPATGTLLLYLKYWRGVGDGSTAVTYQFDRPFTIASGLVGATVSNANTRLTLPSSGFFDGILRFDGPIASLHVDSDSASIAEQAMSFAVVPEPGLAAGLGVGLAMVAGLGHGRTRGRARAPVRAEGCAAGGR